MRFIAVLSSFSRPAAFAAVMAASLFGAVASHAQAEDFAAAGTRTISVVPAAGQAGGTVDVSVELDSQGDEVATSFSLGWDPAVLSNPVVTLGTGAPAGASLGINANQAAQGRLGILLDATVPFGLSPANRQVVSVRFNIAASAPQGTSLVNFVTAPTPQSVSNAQGSLLPTVYQVGVVSIMAADSTPITISGRVTSPTGQLLRSVQVSLIDSAGVRRIATTSSFGVFTFNNVPSNREYNVTVSSKRYRFAPRTITPTDSVTNLDFVGLE